MVSTREEIREGVGILIGDGMIYSKTPDIVTRDVIDFLHSKGVVIKVDRGHREARLPYETAFVEPLIED